MRLTCEVATLCLCYFETVLALMFERFAGIFHHKINHVLNVMPVILFILFRQFGPDNVMLESMYLV